MLSHQKYLIRVNNLITSEFSYPANDLELAMAYAANGGKRLRALLVYFVGDLLNIPCHCLDHLAKSLEYLHAYSLVHDDLPAMDNDDLRRGKPSCHKKFSEATAILAGDALLTLAFEVIAGAKHIDASDKMQLIKILTQAAGYKGMVLGQSIDLSAAKKTLTKDELISMHQHKTGALFAACIKMPLALVKVSSQVHTNLNDFAKNLGLLFQVQDDLLEATSSSNTLGKSNQSDMLADKATFVSILGLKNARLYAKELEKQILACLATIQNSNDLTEFSQKIFQRSY